MDIVIASLMVSVRMGVDRGGDGLFPLAMVGGGKENRGESETPQYVYEPVVLCC